MTPRELRPRRVTRSSSRAGTTFPASPCTTATAGTAGTGPGDDVYSAVSHYRIPALGPLTALELRALLLRHVTCIAGHGHTPQDCSARTQLLEIVAQ